MTFSEEIKHDDKLLAIIIRNDFTTQGIHFFTAPTSPQQLAQMSHPAGKTIKPHFHNPVLRTIESTLEVLFVKQGKVRVDFYADTKEQVTSRMLSVGDVILLYSGGHGFEVVEDLEMIEVKQGPYYGDSEKTQFEGVRR